MLAVMTYNVGVLLTVVGALVGARHFMKGGRSQEAGEQRNAITAPLLGDTSDLCCPPQTQQSGAL